MAGSIALVSSGRRRHALRRWHPGREPVHRLLRPGLILGGLFRIGSFIVVVLGLRHVRLAPFMAFAIGCAQMIWIVVELAIIGEFSFLHPTFFGVGLFIAVAAVPWGWPTFEAWRRSR
jgi:hypothetical protein